MACKAYRSKIINNTSCICLRNSGTKFLKKTWKNIILALLINGILVRGSYNYVQHLAYKEKIQIIEIENYKNKQINTEETKIQAQNMSVIMYIEEISAKKDSR